MASNVVDVYVKLPSGRTSVLKLLPTDLVRKINEQIGKEEEIPVERVRIKYQGKVLDKKKTIGYLGIRPETILKTELVVPKQIKVFAKLYGKESVPVEIRNTDTLLDLKCAVEKSDVIAPKKITAFKHSGQTYLPTNTILCDTSITDESVIDITIRDDTTTNTEEVTNNDEQVVDSDLKDAVLSSFQTDGKSVEVVFSFDTTGSMSSYLHRVRSNLRETCKRLLRDIPNIRIGLIAHGDYCDQTTAYVIKIQDLTNNVDDLVNFATDTSSTGGGDCPECYELVLHKAQQLDWSEDSAKALIVIGDYEPHPPSYTDQKINWHTELDILKGMDVKVYGVFCNNRNDTPAKNFYQELAERTGGCLLTLANFNLITEMFIGVCYKESNAEQLETFAEELKEEGKFTEETETLMKQLEETKPKDEENDNNEQSYLKKFRYSWWDFENDNGTLYYTYDQENDVWKSYSRPSSTIILDEYKPTKMKTKSSSVKRTKTPKVACNDPSSHNYVSKHKQSQKRSCSVM